MGPFLMRFHIRDLEQFTGVKAHTIRVWERRYGLLKPGRTDTNIRTYDITELKAILNVAYLNQHGHKISHIAAMPEPERERTVRTLIAQEGGSEGIIQTLVLAMLGFDEVLFERTCTEHERVHGFRSLMEDVLARLLERIGLLWQSSAICPAQEHFASNLIRQRIIAATNALGPIQGTGAVHVLYLPEEEIHEIGLLYVNHLLRMQGQRTIYLGQSVPREDLRQLAALTTGEITFICLSVIRPDADDAIGYLRALRNDHPDRRIRFLLAGTPLKDIAEADVPDGMRVLPNLGSLIRTVAPAD
ncbi:MAG: MerR family transcriptional regulator [Flavobacteriales bacterium]|nr:MerR family transcriptional regulator [Flavobacteriales bacterium]